MPDTTEILQLIENGENASAEFKTENIRPVPWKKNLLPFQIFIKNLKSASQGMTF